MVKKPYEISIWKDVPVYNDSGQFLYFDEEKVAIIGSNTMTSPARAFEPKLVRNVNGTNTFTFKLYYRYTETMVSRLHRQFEDIELDVFDIDAFENPFTRYITNETKLKVKYDNKWYDFVVKNCQEDSANKCITYTCKDLFIQELSKNGFNLEFDDELENSMGTATDLARQILKDTDWQVKDGDILRQTVEGPVYDVTLSKWYADPKNKTPILAKNDDYDPKKSDSGPEFFEIYSDERILVYYNSVVDDNSFVQFIYDPEHKYERDGTSQLVIGGYQCSIEPCDWVHIKNPDSEDPDKVVQKTCMIKSGPTDKDGYMGIFTINLEDGVSTQYRGKRLVRTQKTVWDPLVEKWVSVYTAKKSWDKEMDGEWINLFNKGDTIHGYIETETAGSELVTNLIVNGSDFTGDNTGWLYERTNGNIETALLYNGQLIEFSEEKAAEFEQIVDNILRHKSEWIDDKEGGRPILQTFIKFPTHTTCTNKGPTYSQQVFPNGIAVGDRLVLRCKAYKLQTKGDITTAIPYNIKNGGVGAMINMDAAQATIALREGEYNPSTGWYQLIYPFSRPISYENLKNIQFSMSVQENDIWFEEIQLFKYVERATKDGEKEILYPYSSGQIQLAVVQPYYKYYKPSEKIESVKDIQYISNSAIDWYLEDYLERVYNTNFEQVRSIKGKESNRFNLLQTVAETFKCWCRFEIEHDPNTGKILTKDDENGIPTQQKYVTFVEEIGKETGVGFVYGIDLKSISRTIQSDQLVTKTIVKDNSNEFAPSGLCTIARAQDNYPKEKFILNFDYYINQGFLTQEEVENALYNSDYGYYTKLHNINTKLDELSRQLFDYKNELEKTETERNLQMMLIDARVEAGQSYEQAVKDVTGCSTLSAAMRHTIGEEGLKTMTTTYTVDRSGGGGGSAAASSPELSASDAKEFSEKFEALFGTMSWLEHAKIGWDTLGHKITELKIKIDNAQDAYDKQLADKKEEDKKFFQRFSRYIQEGSWISEDYIDDNLYYIDAQSVAYTSSRPQVSYNISVLCLDALEDFVSKHFDVGDIAFIQDTEFFGYTYISGIKTPYKEKVLVSESTSNFDEPDKDSLKIQNYKTQFEDLFQRVSAATQQLKFAEGSYVRAANAIDTDGSISDDALQGALDNNDNVKISYDNLQIDAEGAYLIDPVYNNKHLKLAAAGIFLSADGGRNWVTGIDADGINTSKLKAGQIDTTNINLYDGNNVAFRWDRTGINAYFNTGANGIQVSKFVRFDKYGIYGVDLGNNYHEYIPKTEQDIWDDAKFGMTWKGFFLKNKEGSGWVEVSTTDDIRVMADKGQERIRIGRLPQQGGGSRYGLRLQDSSNKITLEADERGQLWLKSGLIISDDKYNKTGAEDRVAIGYLKNISSEKYPAKNGFNQVFNANNHFIVYEDGSIVANRGTFAGHLQAASGSFQGHVDARTGSIGGWIIGETDENGGVAPNLHSVQKVGDKYAATLYGATGLIDAQRINIGREARIVDYIKLGGDESPDTYESKAAYIFNPDYDEDPYGIRKGMLSRIFLKAGDVSLTAEGKMWLGENTESQILLDGTQSIIQGGGAMQNGDGGLLNFKITPNWSIFKNIEVWGKIVTAVFEANHVQAVGGAMIFKPSHKVTSFNNRTLTLEEEFIGSVGDFIILVDKEGNQLSATNAELHNQDNYEELSTEAIDSDIFQVVAVSGSTIAIHPEYQGNTEVDMIVNFGEDGSMIIGANSNWGGKDYLRSRGITLSEFNMISGGGIEVIDEDSTESYAGYIPLEIWSPELEQKGLIFDVNSDRVETQHKQLKLEFAKGREWGRDPKIFLGDMDSAGIAFNDALPKGYGLYSNNVYLNGSLITRVTDETGKRLRNSYAGVSTTSSAYAHPKIYKQLSTQLNETDIDDSRIVFFAGAADTSAGSIQQAPFQVTAAGSLYAQRALLEKGLVSKSQIISPDIYAARIHGNNQDFSNDSTEYGLSFYNLEQGIGFFNADVNGPLPAGNKPVFAIGVKGFRTLGTVYNKDGYFINVASALNEQNQSITEIIMRANSFKTEAAQYNGNTYYLDVSKNKIQTHRIEASRIIDPTVGIILEDNRVQIGSLSNNFDNDELSLRTIFTKDQVTFETPVVQMKRVINFGDNMQYIPRLGGYDLYVY